MCVSAMLFHVSWVPYKRFQRLCLLAALAAYLYCIGPRRNVRLLQGGGVDNTIVRVRCQSFTVATNIFVRFYNYFMQEMKEPKYLKPHIHYSDLYDRGTVEQCRRSEQRWAEDEKTPLKGKKAKEEARIQAVARELFMHFETGNRYVNKDKTVREWMENDRKRDELLESAPAPEGIRCLACRNLVTPSHKQLWFGFDKPDRVLFMYDCPNKCVPSRAFFSDGEEWRIKPDLCPRCNAVLDTKLDDDGKKLLTTSTCPKCKYVNVEEHIWLHKKDEGFDENFAKDRDRFCLSEEDGRKFEQEQYQLEQMGKFMEEFKEKEKARDEKLKANPKGFHLDGAGYTCFICRASTPLGDNWYDQYGIKCLVCQWAIDRKEIPPSLAKDKDSWYSKYDFEHYFNVKTPTLRKWIKEGLIKSRTISHYGQGIHYELFLIKDNKDFLPPKKMIESHSVKEVKDGKTWHQMHPWYHFVDPHKHLKGYKIMEHLRVVPPEEVKARKEEEERKWKEKQARREAR